VCTQFTFQTQFEHSAQPPLCTDIHTKFNPIKEFGFITGLQISISIRVHYSLTICFFKDGEETVLQRWTSAKLGSINLSKISF
jgi:hypothetical protein